LDHPLDFNTLPITNPVATFAARISGVEYDGYGPISRLMRQMLTILAEDREIPSSALSGLPQRRAIG
jgi:hypothetical protein